MVTGVKKLGGTLGSVAAGGLKVFTAGVAAASAGVTVLGKKAVESFADYEQLVGGIETLFGAGGITKVQDYAKSVGKSASEVKSEFNMLMEAQNLALDNANRAYATAGLSANDYMETVTSFAASLKQSCKDELEAAEAANQAVIDMSDNANKMGTDMTMIQNAYQGFAKQNYTMLDNLKLGYGGTKEEMQRLLADAEKLSGIKYDISNLNDVFSAIHVIQEELGITGTTAKEASTTISGSLNMTKAAWSNMLVAMTTDSMDFDTAVNNLVESAAVAAENLLPRIEATLNGMGKLIEALLPVIMDRVPAIINDVLPSLIQSGIGMITALVEGIHQNLPQIFSCAREIVNSILTGIGEIAPLLFEIGFSILLSIEQGIIEEIPTIVQAIVEIIPYISDAFNENAPILLQAALDLFMAIVDAIPLIIEGLSVVLPDIITTLLVFFLENIPVILDGAIQLLMAIVDAIPIIIQGVVENLPQIITAFIDGLIGAVPQLLEASIILLMALIDAIPEIVLLLVENLPQIITALVDGLIGAVPEIFTAAKDLLWQIIEAIPEIVTGLAEAIPDIITGIVNGLAAGAGAVWEGAKSLGRNIIDGFKDMLGIHSPSAVMEEQGDYLTQGLVNGLATLPDRAIGAISGILDGISQWGVEIVNRAIAISTSFVDNMINLISQLPGRLLEILTQILSNVINWGNNMLLKAQKTGMDFVNGIINFLKELPGKISTLLNEIIKKVTSFVTDMANKATEAGKGFFNKIVEALAGLPDKMYEIGSNIVSGIWNGISAGWDWLVGKVKDLANSLFEGAKEALDIHSPSRKFKWLAEMCVAGWDEGAEDLMNPAYMTKNINASLSAMKSNFSGTKAAGVAGYGDFKQTININREISTPDELARAVRVEMRYGLMRGVPVG